MSGFLPGGLSAKIADLAARYPEPPAALLPSLHLVQAEIGWIPAEAEEEVAGLLGLSPIQIREAVTFYSMFRRRPAGRHDIRICRGLSCSLAGSESVLNHLKDRLGIDPGQTTSDGRFRLEEVECLGHCENGPCGLIDFEALPRLTPESLDAVLDGLD